MTDQSRAHAIPERVGGWTQEQWEAIHRKGHHLLVSAAAGAGKTAVLVERIVQRLLDPRDPCDIDRLLVVTFTEAAAAQMRDRISQSLQRAVADRQRPDRERARLRRQLILLDRAPIETLHGFCLWLLRRYFYRIDLDPLFRVLDPDEAVLLREDVMDRVLETAFNEAAQGETTFFRLLDAYGGRQGDVRVRRAVLDLHAYIASLSEPEAWMAQVVAMYDIPANEPIENLPWTGLLLEAVAREMAFAGELLARARNLASRAGAADRAQQILASEHDLAIILREAAMQGNWQRLAAELAEPLSFARLTLTGVEDDLIKDRIRKARDEAKEAFKDVQERYFALRPAEQIQLLRETGPYVRELIRLLRAFDTAYSAAKRQRGVVDFNDLEQLALTVLRLDADEGSAQGTALSPRDEMRAYFDEVLVDEYQDINPVQDAILSRVARAAGDRDPNLFMVGDVKQSIYRFRMADPDLFLDRMHRYSTSTPPKGTAMPEGIRIDLSANFRSRVHVLDAVNYLFRQVLTPGTGGLSYDRAAELQAGAEFPNPSTPHVELHLLERAKDRVLASEFEGDDSEPSLPDAGGEAESLLSAAEREAWFAAQRVRELFDQGFHVYDRETESMRPLQYRDIVVLLRSTRVRANAFVDAFRAFDIPVYAESGTGYFQAVEIETMVSLLQIIDNPRQDIPLAAVLRAPWVGLSTHDLAQIRLADPEGEFFSAVTQAAAQRSDDLGKRLRSFLDQLDRWRTVARRKPLSHLLRQVYLETEYPDYVLGMPGGPQRKANLEALLARAQGFDSFGQGDLGRFLHFIDSIQAAEGDQGEAPLLGEGDDVVRVMSIHKSKGLQFPVVILADSGKRFNLEDAQGQILFQGHHGVALEWVDPNLGLSCPTLAQRAVGEARRRESIAEELRVLYVALTRAQEHLIIIGSVSDVGATCARWGGAVDLKNWALPDYILGRAQTYLDWIGPAVMRHRDGEPLRQLAAAEDGRTFTPQDAEIAADPSRWQVMVHRTVTFETPARSKGTDVDGAVDLQHLGAGQSLGRTVPADIASELAERLEWEYPQRVATVWPAKVSVTLLAREWSRELSLDTNMSGEGDETRRRLGLGTGGDPEEGVHEQFRRLALFRPQGAGPERGKSAEKRIDEIAETLRVPSWEHVEPELPSAAARGTATHLLLDRLDIRSDEPITVARLDHALKQMVAADILTEAEAGAVDREAIAAFWQSEVGLRIQGAARRGQLWREWAFSMAMDIGDVAEVWRTNMPIEKDKMVVQGTIDALWQEEDGRYCLIDYKTDRPRGAAEDLVKRYRPQVFLYARAVEAVLEKPAEAYLALLTRREIVPILSADGDKVWE